MTAGPRVDARRRAALRPASLLLAAVCVAVLALHVSPAFKRIRIRPGTGAPPPGATTMSVALPDLTRLSTDPAALIVQARAGATPIRLRTSIDGTIVSEVAIEAGASRRIDTAVSLPGGTGHRLTFDADGTGWTVTYLELSNVFGFSSGLVDFNIMPAARQTWGLVPWWVLAPFALLLVAAAPGVSWPVHRWGRRAHRVASALILVLFVAVLASSLISPYRLMLGGTTFVLAVATLYLEPLARFWSWSGLVRLPWPVIGSYVPHAWVVAFVLSTVSGYVRPDVGFTTLIRFGRAFEAETLPALKATPHASELGSGYDGQFYAQLALDPLLRDPAIRVALDSPGYRGRRILFPWIAATAGLGRPWYVLQAYALVNVAAWLAFGWVLLRWLPGRQVKTTLAWVTCMLSAGLLTSIRTSVPDGASVLFLALGIAALEAGRRWTAVATFGLAGLARETNILFGAALVDERPSRRWITSLPFALAGVVLPLAIWLAVLSWRGFAGDTGARNFAWPLAAYAERWVISVPPVLRAGMDSVARFSLYSLVSLTAQVIGLAVATRRDSAWWRVGVMYALLMIVLGGAVWEGHPSAADRVLLPMTIAFNVLVPSSRWFWPLWILGNLSVLNGLDALQAAPFL